MASNNTDDFQVLANESNAEQNELGENDTALQSQLEKIKKEKALWQSSCLILVVGFILMLCYMSTHSWAADIVLGVFGLILILNVARVIGYQFILDLWESIKSTWPTNKK